MRPCPPPYISHTGDPWWYFFLDTFQAGHSRDHQTLAQKRSWGSLGSPRTYSFRIRKGPSGSAGKWGFAPDISRGGHLCQVCSPLGDDFFRQIDLHSGSTSHSRSTNPSRRCHIVDLLQPPDQRLPGLFQARVSGCVMPYESLEVACGGGG